MILHQQTLASANNYLGYTNIKGLLWGPFFTAKYLEGKDMKKIIIIGYVIALASCDISIPKKAFSDTLNFSSSNTIYNAVQKLGLDENTDRQELKEFLEIDPARTEWCAAFINSVLEESGIISNKDHKYPLTARAFLDWGNKVTKENIQPGDIVVFPRGNQGWQGHAGFYINTVEIEGIEYYKILGGNQNDRVSIENYKSSTVLGIRRYVN